KTPARAGVRWTGGGVGRCSVEKAALPEHGLLVPLSEGREAGPDVDLQVAYHVDQRRILRLTVLDLDAEVGVTLVDLGDPALQVLPFLGGFRALEVVPAPAGLGQHAVFGLGGEQFADASAELVADPRAAEAS